MFKKFFYSLLTLILLLPNFALAGVSGGGLNSAQFVKPSGLTDLVPASARDELTGWANMETVDLNVSGLFTFGGTAFSDFDMDGYDIDNVGNINITVADGDNQTGITVTMNDVTNNPNAVVIDSQGTATDALSILGKYGAKIEQDIADGYGLWVTRNLAEVGSAKLATFAQVNATDTQGVFEITNAGSGADITAPNFTLTEGVIASSELSIGDSTDLPAGASAGHLIKTTLGAGATYTGTTAGLTVKNYDADATVDHDGGENTGLAIFYKQLSAMASGGESSIASLHTHSSTDQKLTNGVVLYPKAAGSAFAVRAATVDYGYDLADASNVVVTTADYRGHEGDIIFNDPAGTWNFGSANIATTGSLSLGGGGSLGDITILKETDDAVGATLTFFKDTASPAADDDIMVMTFDSNDDLGARKNYGRFTAEIKDPDNSDLDGKLKFEIVGGGTLREAFNVQGLATSSQVQFTAAATFSSTLQMDDNRNFVLGNTGATSGAISLSTSQDVKTLRVSSDTTGKMILFDNGSTTNNYKIAAQSTNTLVIASGVTEDPDVTNNVWGSITYDSNLVLSGAPHLGASGSAVAIKNNGVAVRPQAITNTQTESFGFITERTINDPNVAGGSDVYVNNWSKMTLTDTTGADEIYHFKATSGANDVFTVSELGKVVVNELTTPTTDTVAFNHGGSGAPSAGGTRALINTAYYGGNVTAGTTQLNDTHSTGLTTAGNLMSSYSATVEGHASDAASTYITGYIADYVDNGGSESTVAFGSLHTSDDWDFDFGSVAGDNKITAIAVAPGDGFDVHMIGGDAITGGSAQAGGDVVLYGGTQSGGGADGNVIFAEQDGTTAIATVTSDDEFEINQILVVEPSGDTSLLAATQITVTNENMRVVGNGGAVTLTGTPTIVDPASDGTIVTIQGTNDTNTVKLQDEAQLANTGLQLSGGNDFTLGLGDTITLQYDSGDDNWYERSRSDN